MYIMSWCICNLCKYEQKNITGESAPRWGAPMARLVCVCLRSLPIHQETLYTDHVLILSRPKPGGGVYIWCDQRRM